MPGQITLDQGGHTADVLDLLELAGIEEAAEGVCQFQRPQGRQAGTEVLDDHARHLEAPGQGGDGGEQVEADVARGERRLVLFQIAERSDLGQEDGTAAGLAGQGGGEGPGSAAVGQQDDGVGQGLGRMVAQPVQNAGRQIVEKGSLGLDRIPARARAGKRIEGVGHASASFASAASRARGSPTCIQSPSSTQPYSRPAAADRRQKPLSEKGPSGPSAT